jgi:hypothetical protein
MRSRKFNQWESKPKSWGTIKLSINISEPEEEERDLPYASGGRSE